MLDIFQNVNERETEILGQKTIKVNSLPHKQNKNISKSKKSSLEMSVQMDLE